MIICVQPNQDATVFTVVCSCGTYEVTERDFNDLPEKYHNQVRQALYNCPGPWADWTPRYDWMAYV